VNKYEYEYAVLILLFVHIKFLGAALDPRNTVYPG
jgi:hypothetical protein